MGHPAAFPEALARFWIKYLCPPGGLVLDPFAGSGTTCAVAKALGRAWVGIEKRADYARKARLRIAQTPVGIELPTSGGEVIHNPDGRPVGRGMARPSARSAKARKANKTNSARN